MSENIEYQAIEDKFAVEEVKLSSLQRIFFARVLDLVLSLVPSLVFSTWYHATDWKSALIVVSASFGLLFFYFILLAYWCHGNTLCKLMLGIKIIHTDGTRTTFYDVFIREVYHIFVPWLFQLLAQIIVVVISTQANSDGNDKVLTTLALSLQNIGYLFYMVWFIYLGVTIRGQELHQSGIDMRRHLVCVYLGYGNSHHNNKQEKLPDEAYVHLKGDRPGEFDLDELKKLVVEEDESDERDEERTE